MTNFEIKSEKSLIGLILSLIVILIIAFKFLLTVNLLISIAVLIAILLPLIYMYFTTKSTLLITDDELIIENTSGLPAKRSTVSKSLRDIDKIILRQTHESLSGHKYIIFKTGDSMEKFEIPFRYYQMVKIQEYFNNNTDIKTELIG